MTDARVLILHGVEHHREHDHWLWWLAEELRRRRIPVQYPQMPDADAPSLEAWSGVAKAEFEMLGTAKRIVIAHSLGTILWGHLAASLAPELRATDVLLVAPPSPDIFWPAIETFQYDATALGAGLAHGSDSTTVIAREDDPYRPVPLAALTEGWPAETIELPGSGHINTDDGHETWPWVLEWVEARL